MAKKPSTAHSSHDDHGHGEPAAATGNVPAAMDYAAHESTYARFTNMVKWAIVACAVVVIFLFVAIHPMITTASS